MQLPKTTLLLITVLFCSCQQELYETTLYFKNGKVKSGFTPRKTYFNPNGIIKWKKKEQAIWLRETPTGYLDAYTINSDSFNLVELDAKRKLFAISKVRGPVDLYSRPYMADSCTTSDMIEAMELLDGLLEIASIFSGEYCPVDDDDWPDDDDCQKVVRFPSESYILVDHQSNKRLWINQSEFSCEHLFAFFSGSPSFQNKLARTHYTFEDVPEIVEYFNEKGSSSTLDETTPISINRIDHNTAQTPLTDPVSLMDEEQEALPESLEKDAAKIVFYLRKPRNLNHKLTIVENGQSTLVDFSQQLVQQVYVSNVLDTSICFDNATCLNTILKPNETHYIEVLARKNKAPELKQVDTQKGSDWVEFLESVHKQ